MIVDSDNMIFFENQLEVVDFCWFTVSPPDAHPLQPISGPCDVTIYPREWRSTIPASVMRVDDK